MSGRTLDVNCDLGEGYGNFAFGADEHMLSVVSTANIACGFHAGDPPIMRRTVELCRAENVRIGAHPGLPDLPGFGRRLMAVSENDVYCYWAYQLGALDGFVRQQGATMGHAKPHGAMYQLMATDEKLGTAALRAMMDFDSSLTLYFPGPLTAAMVKAIDSCGVEVVEEVYVDLSYGPDGSILVERNKGAVSVDVVKERVRRFVQDGVVRCVDDSMLPIAATSLCVHSDTANAVEIVDAVIAVLAEEGVEVAAP